MTDEDDTDKTNDTALRDPVGRRTRTLDLGGPTPKRIFDQVSIVAVVIDTDMRIVRYNRAAERLFGITYGNVLGKPYDEALPVLSEINDSGIFQRTVALGVPAEVKEFRIINPETGEEFYFDFAIDPILGDNGEMAGVSVIGLEVTERAALKTRLTHQNEDLAALQHVSDALRKTMDLEKAFFIVASALTSDEGGAYDHAMIFTVDQDREFLVGQVCVDSIGLRDVWGVWRGLTGHDAPLKQSLKANQPVLARRWGELSDTIKKVRVPLSEETSVLVHAVTTGETITHEVLDGAKPLRLHDAIKQHFPMERFTAAPLLADHEAIGVVVVEATSSKKPISPERLTTLEMFANQAGLAISNGQMYQNVLDRAQRDSLTHLYNHGHFQEVLKNEMERASRYEHPLSLIMLDIDNFKDFNDTYGHQTGDAVLKQTGLLLSALVRVTDLPARYGGEEFGLLLPHTDYDSALELAERLRAGVERKILVKGPKGEKIGVTATFGVSSFPDHADNPPDLVMSADAAMYIGKERGRNCVVGADDVDDVEETTARKLTTKRPTMKQPRKKRADESQVRVKTPGTSNRRRKGGASK